MVLRLVTLYDLQRSKSRLCHFDKKLGIKTAAYIFRHQSTQSSFTPINCLVTMRLIMKICLKPAHPYFPHSLIKGFHYFWASDIYWTRDDTVIVLQWTIEVKSYASLVENFLMILMGKSMYVNFKFDHILQLWCSWKSKYTVQVQTYY